MGLPFFTCHPLPHHLPLLFPNYPLSPHPQAMCAQHSSRLGSLSLETDTASGSSGSSSPKSPTRPTEEGNPNSLSRFCQKKHSSNLTGISETRLTQDLGKLKPRAQHQGWVFSPTPPQAVSQAAAALPPSLSLP